jgi:hypothetical protein
VRTEQGVYSSPSPRLLNCYLELGNFETEEEELVILDEYREFQKLTREFYYGALKRNFDFSSTFPDGHPWVVWREFSGLDARIIPSKYYCVHPAILTRFETKPWLVSHVPEGLQMALMESGYDSELLARFRESYTIYRAGLSQEKLTA